MAITESAKNWASVRAVIEALILAALLWTGNSLTTMRVQLAILQSQLAAVSTTLADVADLKSRTAVLERTAATNSDAIREIRAELRQKESNP